MRYVRVLAQALAMTAKDRIHDLLTIAQSFRPSPTFERPSSPWMTSSLMVDKTVDGAVLFGVDPNAGAKFALPKGLPKTGQRTLAIENEPHSVDNFSGEIKEGYGKGMKTLLADETIVLKIKGKSIITRMNYHVHDAEKAGLHYDLVIKDLPEGTEKFEINIPRGEYKGRYSFVTTPKGIVVVPMVDRSVVLPKPEYRLKNEDFLADIVASNPEGYVIERKVDGSLGNAVIEADRAYFRSHREQASPYIDKLPALEFLRNRSPYLSLRTLDPFPRLSGTVIKGELIHEDGVSRVSGILNAHPAKAQAMQKLRGPVKFQAWDISKFRGKDVSNKSAGQRRELLESTIREIRRFNPNWNIVERYTGKDPIGFYQSVVTDPRGLPYSEGIVIKPIGDSAEGTWVKLKRRDFEDFIVIDMLSSKPGTKYAESAAVLIVRDPVSNAIGEVGSFSVTDAERQWIWNHREELKGAVAKILVVEKTAKGVPRAGVFHGWHGDPRYGGVGTEMALSMYSESLAGGDPIESKEMLYKLKSSAGWRRA